MECPYCKDKSLENHSKDGLISCFRQYLEDSTPMVEPSQKQMMEHMGGLGYIFRGAESNLSEATLKRLRKTYDQYEDRNEHLSNYLLLATFFGTDADKEEVKKIMARRNKRGSLTAKENTWLYENINPYYDHLRNVKAAETFEARYNKNGTIAYNEKEWVGDLGNERGAVFLGSDGNDRYFYIHGRIVKVVDSLKNETLVQPVIDFNPHSIDGLTDNPAERRKLAKIIDEVMKNYDRHTEYRRAETYLEGDYDYSKIDSLWDKWISGELSDDEAEILIPMLYYSERDEDGKKAVDVIQWVEDENNQASSQMKDLVRDYFSSEEFNVEFDDWADQEMLTHGQDISFRDWAKDEGKKHGNVPITDWAEHEEESHDERYGAETFEAQPNRRIKTMIESSPNLRIDSSFHPDNPAVGHITQKCSSSDCDEMIKTHDSRIGKRCLKCYYENWEDLYAMGVIDTPPPTDIENKNRYTRKTPAEHQEQERKSKELMEHLRKRDEEKLGRLRQYQEDRVKEKGKWDKANPTEREDMIRDSWKRINGSGIKPWRAESNIKRNGMIAAGIVAAFALLPEIKKRF